MMPFFLTMPISRMMPMKAISDSSVPNSLQRQQRAEPGRRQRRDDGQRMREALVEHAEHDVDREQRREDQQRLRADRLPVRRGRRRRIRRAACRACAFRRPRGRRLRSPPRCVTSGARLKLMVTAGNWPWWLITSGCEPRSILVTATSGTCAPLAPAHIDARRGRSGRADIAGRSRGSRDTGCAGCRAWRSAAARRRC